MLMGLMLSVWVVLLCAPKTERVYAKIDRH